jgi:hypothetical protein
MYFFLVSQICDSASVGFCICGFCACIGGFGQRKARSSIITIHTKISPLLASFCNRFFLFIFFYVHIRSKCVLFSYWCFQVKCSRTVAYSARRQRPIAFSPKATGWRCERDSAHLPHGKGLTVSCKTKTRGSVAALLACSIILFSLP